MHHSSEPNPFPPTGKTTCLEMLQLVLDGQATAEQVAYFRIHMDACMPCYKTYNLDMAIKEMLQCKCCTDQVPADLIDRIKSQVNQIS